MLATSLMFLLLLAVVVLVLLAWVVLAVLAELFTGSEGISSQGHLA
jgi:hypothetical protein